MTGAAILCIENPGSRFAESQALCGGSYDIITATSVASALIALRSVARIRAAVLPGAASHDQQVRMAARLDEVRPGLPKVVLCSNPTDEDEQELKLHLSYITDFKTLTCELDELAEGASEVGGPAKRFQENCA